MQCASVIVSIAMATVVVCSGCGDSTPGGYVTGKVESGGELMPAGNKVFFEQSVKGLLAAGVIQEDGTYTLNYKGSPKIPMGDYIVFVGPPTSHMTEKEFYAFKAKVNAQFRSRGKKPPPFPDWILPAKFYRSTTSPLRETVELGDNVIDLLIDD